MKIGHNIRDLRKLKGYSQENMAAMLSISLMAYGEIEQNRSDISLSRVEQITRALDVPVQDLFNFSDRVSNFFDQCSSVVAGVNNGGLNHYDKELKHELEKAKLQIENLKMAQEKADLEVRYWREKFENLKNGEGLSQL